MYPVLFDSLLYFQRYALHKLFIAKIEMGSNSVNAGNRAEVLAFCTFSDGPLSMHQVSFNSLIYFQRYAPDKLFIAKIKKGSNTVIIGERVMVLALCNSPRGPPSLY